MAPEPTFYSRPEGVPFELQVGPRLASWNATLHVDQQNLSAALDHAEGKLAPSLATTTGPVALRLDVGLAGKPGWLHHYDLDNYVFPLARRLTIGRDLELVSVWATKSADGTSSIRWDKARETAMPEGFDYSGKVSTTASSTTGAYKSQIHEQVLEANVLADGPVALELAFVVGPRRNWLNLWKPTIDALGPLLGTTQPNRQWHPQDGRITELGLHRSIDPNLGNAVVVTVVARSVGQ